MGVRYRAEQADNDVRILRRVITAVGNTEPVEDVLNPDDALEFAMSIIQAASHAHVQRTRNAVTGECATCNNERMVYQQTDKHYRTNGLELVHCPDCGIRYAQADSKIPQPGAMVTLNAEGTG